MKDRKSRLINIKIKTSDYVCANSNCFIIDLCFEKKNSETDKNIYCIIYLTVYK